MSPRYESEHRTFSRVITLALALGAATGWGMWFVSGQWSGRTERELREQLSTLTQSQMQLLHEREMAEAAGNDVASLQSQIASLRKEFDDLSQQRDRMQAERRAAGAGGPGNVAAKPDHDSVTETGSTTTLDHPEKVFVATAQKALTKLGYGPLSADGVMGPGTRRAIEEFQYKNGLPVTKELDTATLQRLGEVDSVAAAD